MDTVTAGECRRTEALYGLMEAKLALLTGLLDLATQQSEVVTRHETQELMTLLARKQVLMDRLFGLQSEFATFASDDPEERRWLTPERRRECQRMKDRCDGLIHELLVLENRAIDNMALQREVIGSQTQQVADAMRLSKAYSAGAGEDWEAGSSVSLTG